MSRKKTKQERFLEIKPQLSRTHVSVRSVNHINALSTLIAQLEYRQHQATPTPDRKQPSVSIGILL
jgi:hypothetical protein